ncbi:hypothetical protein [Clostridium sp.]|jgi:hypothetical protein|uniref:hypothetical protein n=1 Tax=Clostridium sp. TaxID=1506 RepID=UPI003EF04D99
MNKNKLKETKKSDANFQLNIESATGGLTKVLSNEQANEQANEITKNNKQNKRA